MKFTQMEGKCYWSCSLADVVLCKVALSTSLLQGNIAIYKKGHKEIYNLCWSHSTSGNNSREAKIYAHSCDKSIIMSATKQKNLKKTLKSKREHCLVNHGASLGCSILQPLKAAITEAMWKQKNAYDMPLKKAEYKIPSIISCIYTKMIRKPIKMK